MSQKLITVNQRETITKDNIVKNTIESVSIKITEKLQIEKINLSKILVKPRDGGLGSVTFYTDIKEGKEFAKFALNFDERNGRRWRARPLLRNSDLPIAKSQFLSDFLRMIIEDVLNGEVE